MIATAKSKAKGKEDIFDVRVASYVLVIPKRWPIHAIAFMGSIRLTADSKNKEERIMEQVKKQTKNKGGRPKKAIKKDKLIPVKCSSFERRVIIGKAKSANVSTSEYMREIALTGKIDRREKALPKEVLQLIAMLNHIAAYLNQIAKKRNGFEELSALERANLKAQSAELKQLAATIKSHLQ